MARLNVGGLPGLQRNTTELGPHRLRKEPQRPGEQVPTLTRPAAALLRNTASCCIQSSPRKGYFQTGCLRIAKIQEFKKCRAFSLGTVTHLSFTLPRSAAVPICTLCLVFCSCSKTELVSRKS